MVKNVLITVVFVLVSLESIAQKDFLGLRYGMKREKCLKILKQESNLSPHDTTPFDVVFTNMIWEGLDVAELKLSFDQNQKLNTGTFTLKADFPEDDIISVHSRVVNILRRRHGDPYMYFEQYDPPFDTVGSDKISAIKLSKARIIAFWFMKIGSINETPTSLFCKVVTCDDGKPFVIIIYTNLKANPN